MTYLSRQVVEGEELQIFGDGSQLRDFNFVDDVVRALLLAAMKPNANGSIYNLGGDAPISLLELAKLLIEINGSGSFRIVPFPADRKRIDIGDFHGDYEKINQDLGWRPTISLCDGLERTIKYYKRFREHYW